MRTARLLVLTFAGAGLIGALLLRLPFATTGDSLPFVDCLFTAVSAVCVTGLTVVDTGSGWTPFGRGLIGVLIQLGGLGIMTISTVLLLAAGQSISFRERTVIRDTLSGSRDRSIGDFARYVVRVAILFEAIGALLLTLLLIWRHDRSWGEAIGDGVFLSISSFCNAGFAPWSDSLAGFARDPWLIGTVMVLIVAGGLGFVVLVNLRTRFQGDELGERQRLTLHTRLVLTTTAILLVGGALALLAFEWRGGLAHLPVGERVLAGIFQSVTPRTAGFNLIETGTLAMPSIFVIMLLMLMGAAPGSAGGGLKVTTVAVLWLLARARYRRQERVQVFNRTLPETTVSRALAAVLTGGTFILATIFALLLSEWGRPHGAADQFLQLTFEVVSALSNVGLSMGLTEQLSSAGKLIIVLAMLAGRVGPLTLALAAARSVRQARTHLAEEPVMIG